MTSLPGFDSSFAFPCSYSGLIETHPEVDGNIFYWFFPTETQTEETKLVLWFSGGPGGSGIGSMNDENGPIKFRMSDGNFELYSDIENSFSDIANVIYIDQPFGVGYSYSDYDISTGKEVGAVVLTFLQKFYEIYPEQKELDLVIAGNSYAGHFMPNAVNAILDHNEKVEEDLKIPIYGLLVEDGLVDPITQRLAIKQLALGSGLLTLDLVREYEALENRCEQSVYLDPDAAFTNCKEMNSLLYETDGGWEIMDVRTKAGEFYIGDYMDDYFNQDSVKQQLNIGGNRDKVSYSHFNGTVYTNMRYDGLVDTVPLYEKIVNSGVNTIIYTGNFDGLDGVYGTQLWVQQLGITQNFDDASQKSVYYYQSEGEEKVGGTYKTFERQESGITQKLSYTTVYNAGHVLGITQFPVSKSLLFDLITDGQTRCNKQDGQCATEGNVCGKMENCYNQGECQNSRCKCYEGYFGADCSISPTPLNGSLASSLKEPSVISLFPREWSYYSLPKGLEGEYSIRVESGDNQEVHLYHKVGEAPYRSDFDGHKKGSTVTYIIDGLKEFQKEESIIVAIHNPSKSEVVTVSFSHGVDDRFTLLSN